MKRFIFAIVFCLSVAPAVNAQTDRLKAEIQSAYDDLQSMERILKEMNSIDTAYATSFPTWLVKDPNLRLRLFTSFRNRGKQFSKDDKITVVATPDTQNITDIRIGNISYGKLFAQTLLARDLRQDLIADAMNKVPPEGLKKPGVIESNPIARPSTPDWLSADISLFGASINFSNSWGIVSKIGEDELGYPFFSTGTFRLMTSYKSLKIGAWLPLNAGLNKRAPGEPSSDTERLLNGADGLAGEFEFEWDFIRINSASFPYAAFGGRFAFGGLSARRDELLTPNLDSLFYLSAIVQGYYAFDFLFDEQRQNLNVHLGASFHRVGIGKAVIVGNGFQIFKGSEPREFVDPLVRIEYRNYRFDKFRVTAQYSRLLMLSGWAELIPPFIYAEIKFSTVVLRNPEPWEHRSYVYGTLGFKFEF